MKIGLVLSAVFLLATVPLAGQTRYEDTTFAAIFPGTNVRVTSSVGSEKTNSQGLKFADHTFSASYDNDFESLFVVHIDCDRILAAGDAALDKSIDGGLGNVFDLATLNVVRSTARIGNLYARAATGTGKSKDGKSAILVHIRAAITGNRTWLIFVIQVQNKGSFAFSEAEANQFMDSVVLRRD